MLPDGSDLVAEEMNAWIDLNGMEFYIHYTKLMCYQLSYPGLDFYSVTALDYLGIFSRDEMKDLQVDKKFKIQKFDFLIQRLILSWLGKKFNIMNECHSKASSQPRFLGLIVSLHSVYLKFC